MNSYRRLRPEISPTDFLFGTATAAHQIEGNQHNDWRLHEQTLAPAYEDSGQACNSFELFRQDREAMVDINANAYRLSIEWSRIEPEPGKFSDDAISHYETVIGDLLAHGIEPIITLHHFTNPVWFEQQGGWKNKNSVQHYQRFVQKIVPRLNGRINYWLTMNEPNVMVQHKYMAGIWHPQESRLVRPYFNVYPNLIAAHKLGYDIIKNHNPSAQVGFTSNYASLHPRRNIFFPINYYYHLMYSHFSNDYMYRKLKNHMDFIGLNFYTRAQFSISPFGPLRGKPHITIDPKPPESPDDLEFDAHAQDITPVVKRLIATYKKPVLITENGFVSNDDTKRKRYVEDINQELLKMRADGVALMGYLHWSLLDNYEWNLGRSARFGLYSVDPSTFERQPKSSAAAFAEAAAQHNKLNGSR